MASAHQKVLQYLKQAHTAERGLTRVLESQIAMTPEGSLREALIAHLDETKHHADWVAARLTELRQYRPPRGAAFGRAESVLAQVSALSKTPVDLVRGSGGAEKVLKNTRDACATEAYEIATYTVIEQLAVAAGDHQTAKLAASIRSEEEAMLARLLAELPGVVTSVVDDSYDITRTGAGEAVRETATKVRGAKDKATAKVHTAAGAATAKAHDAADGATTKVHDAAGSATTKVHDAAAAAGAAVHDTVAAVRGDEPWDGYDELTVPAVKAALADADAELIRTVRAYETTHKARAGVLKAVDHDLVDA